MTSVEPEQSSDDERPCSICGNEERTAAGYLTCECPDSLHPNQLNGFPCRCANCVAIRERLARMEAVRG